MAGVLWGNQTRRRRHERLLTARRHIDERRFREAIVELHVVLENETKPNQAEETLELLALANFKAAHLTEAERLARQLISSQPTNAYAHTILVRSLERQSRHEEAARARALAVTLGADL
ncbi:hypothetical protein [Arachnia propionica]|uniref:hypothetical protein n=1 Tax=Arachnia propionica TaxID=1750 RepID=UPI003C6FE7C9